MKSNTIKLYVWEDDGRPGKLAVVVNSDAPNVTVTMTGPDGDAVGVEYRSDASATYLTVVAGRWEFCATSGGEEVGYEVARDCAALDVHAPGEHWYWGPNPDLFPEGHVPELLTIDLLEQMNQALRDVGAAIVDAWEPGLGREQIDALTEPHGFRLPDEAALWWGWHNGGGTADLTPHRRAIRLEGALVDFEAVDGAMDDAYGLSRMLAVTNEQPWMWFDCRGEVTAPVPVWAGYKADQPRIAAQSIGDMVRVVIMAIETGAYTTDERGEWNEPDWDNIPEALSGSGIF